MKTLPAVLAVLLSLAACTDAPPRTPDDGTPSARQLNLDCSDPIDVLSSPPEPHSAVLDVVGLDTTSTLQLAATDGDSPHRLFAKTGLLVRAGHEADLTVPAHVSIAWGNHAPEWASALHIPACPTTDSGQWLLFPGGFSLDAGACVPLQVSTENETTTVHVSAGAPCPS